MKKILFLIIISINLFALNATQIEQKIYSSVLKDLFPLKTNVKVWIDDKNKLKEFKQLNIVKKRKKANILILFKSRHIKTNKMVFIANYSILKYYSNNEIGGFYWQKGRPNLVFFYRNLKKYNLKLPKTLKKYVEHND